MNYTVEKYAWRLRMGICRPKDIPAPIREEARRLAWADTTHEKDALEEVMPVYVEHNFPQ